MSANRRHTISNARRRMAEAGDAGLAKGSTMSTCDAVAAALRRLQAAGRAPNGSGLRSTWPLRRARA